MKDVLPHDKDTHITRVREIYKGSKLRGGLARDMELSQQKPTVPGEPVDYIYIPPRGFLTGRIIEKGQVIRTIDLEGQQCFDCITWDANDLYNVQSCHATTLWNRKWNKWRPGDGIYSKNGDKLVTITEDTTDGTHAVAAGAFCNEAYWRCVFGVSGKPNCRDNFVAAMAAYDFSAKDIDWGSCIAFFMPIIYEPDGSVRIDSVKNKPGDYIDLMAEMDIIIAISNCPSESLTNAYNPTALLSVIFDPSEDYMANVNALKR